MEDALVEAEARSRGCPCRSRSPLRLVEDALVEADAVEDALVEADAVEDALVDDESAVQSVLLRRRAPVRRRFACGSSSMKSQSITHPSDRLKKLSTNETTTTRTYSYSQFHSF